MKTEITERDMYAEDMRLGDSWDLGTYSVSEEEIVAFASQWDPQFFHVDAERSRTEGQFQGLIASGVQTLAIYQRLSVTSRVGTWHVIAGVGIRDLRFRRPVRPGDALTGSTSVEEVQFQTERRRALVTYGGELVNQAGEPVFTLTMSAYVESRPT